jgi:hypothetical protein
VRYVIYIYVVSRLRVKIHEQICSVVKYDAINTFIKECTEVERLQNREHEEQKSIRDKITNISAVMSF